MEKTDVNSAFDPWPVLSNQTFGTLGLRKAQPVNDHRGRSNARFERDSLRAPTIDFYGFRVRQFSGDLRQRIVVAPNDEHPDSGLVQSADLLGKEPRSFHGGLIAVVEITSEKKRVDLLGQAEIDDIDKGTPRRVAYQFA
ncbi:hypothetical protein GCM10010869_06680 [Mesorhizobium tianshanense]|nr:hypothetical protein GCM10010869_06680 [Mesorhizobium tianshanense]